MSTSAPPSASRNGSTVRSAAYRDPGQSTGSDTPPNEVIVWNRVLLDILHNLGAEPLHPTCSLAMMHLAIADAVAAITRRFAPYGFDTTSSRTASAAAAAARAAHEVVGALYPAMKSTVDTELANSLMRVRNGFGKTAGIAIGVRAGQTVLRLRRDDGMAARPFALNRANQFRPGPPPPVTSDTYANALGEVRSLGESSSLTRAPDETQIGQFWSAPIQNYWNEIAQTASCAHHNSLADDARLFALLNISFADDVIAACDAKYAYRCWRPVRAIGNDGIRADASWAPLGKTASDPSYPSAHSVISYDAATILGDEFGDQVEFDVTSAILPGVARHFTSFSAAALEAGCSRIYAGEHFRFDHAAGERLGRRVGRFVAANALGLDAPKRPRR